MLNLKALLRREDRHSIHLRLPKFCAITHPFPQHLNEMSGLTNKEYEDRERTIAQFTAVVRDLKAHRARGRGRRPVRVIVESITLDYSSDDEIGECLLRTIKINRCRMHVMQNHVSLQTDGWSCGIRVMIAAEMLSGVLVPKFPDNTLTEIRQHLTMSLLYGYLPVDPMLTWGND